MKWTAQKESGPGSRQRLPGHVGPEWWVHEHDAPEHERLVAIVPGGPRAKSRALLIGALPQLLAAVREYARYGCAGVGQDVDDPRLCGKCGPCEADQLLRSLERTRAMPRRQLR